ncbi:MAG: carboxypeptidase-like regulatory domain-containing protein, partial [Balneolales bacterium]|nr:carboxypeptidase-like regulatory domain-containing protein [Balneolales bacterium]
MRFHSYIVSLLILVSFPGTGFVTAQTFELKGHLVDSGSGKPLVGAHVFLNKTTIGTVTDEHGAYTLEGIPEGLQLIVFSRVGYKDRAIRIEFPLYQEDYSNLGLEAEPEGFQPVSGSRKWKRNLRAFKKHLLGTTPNSNEVEILNPEVLNFESYNRSLVATANAPLEIVNNALGYKITYFLKESISNNEMFSASFYAKFE